MRRSSVAIARIAVISQDNIEFHEERKNTGGSPDSTEAVKTTVKMLKKSSKKPRESHFAVLAGYPGSTIA